MSTTDVSTEPQGSTGGFRYAAVTLFLLGGVSTITQVIAAASLGVPPTVEWSTGGIVALGAAIWMWIACRTWAAWRRWVWLPVGITVVTVFVSANLMVSAARETTKREAAEEHAARCSAAEVELARMHASLDEVLSEAWEYDTMGWGLERSDSWRPRPDDGMGIVRLAGPSEDQIWAFYSSLGGPQLETDIAAHQVAHAAECGAD